MPGAPVQSSARGYAIRHWQGRLPLWLSVWGNLVGVGAGVYFLQRWFMSLFADEPENQFLLAVVSFAVFRLVLFPWQAVGVLRACERALEEIRNPIWVRGAQGAVLLGILVVLVDGLGVFHAYFALHAERARIAAKPPPLAPPYSLRIGPSGERLYLDGFLEPGVTRATRAILVGAESVRVVMLASRGGRIYEARGLARIFQEGGLDTHVAKDCSSACTIAFMGGERRTLDSAARLGFHAYRLESWNVRPDMDPLSEQQTDMAFFASRGVDVARLARIFDVDTADMWYPPHAVLLEAGVVHGFGRAIHAPIPIESVAPKVVDSVNEIRPESR